MKRIVQIMAPLFLLACTDTAASVSDHAATTERGWVEGSLDFARVDALLGAPVQDAIARADVARESDYFACEATPVLPDGYALWAADNGAAIVTAFPRSVSRTRTRIVDVGNDVDGFRLREVLVEFDDGRDLRGQPQPVAPMWIQDPSVRLTISSGDLVRDRALDFDESPLATLAASTGRVLMMTSPAADGSTVVDLVHAMDGEEILVRAGRSADQVDARRVHVSDLAAAHEAALAERAGADGI
jgi:hypothetical protein